MKDNFQRADAREAHKVIDLAMQCGFMRFLDHYDGMLSRWKAERPVDNREAYRSFCCAVREHHQYITRRYNALSSARYFGTVVGLLIDGILTDGNLTGFSPAAKLNLLATVAVLSERTVSSLRGPV